MIVLLISLAISGMAFSQQIGVNKCETPKDLVLVEATANSASLTWVSPGEVSGWHIEVGELGFKPGSAQFVRKYYFRQANSGISLVFLARGLQPETSYQIYVRSSCGRFIHSDWCKPLTFTTERE